MTLSPNWQDYLPCRYILRIVLAPVCWLACLWADAIYRNQISDKRGRL